jgi:hypothetical protein
VAIAAQVTEFLDGGAGHDLIEHFGVRDEEFVDADAAGIAAIAAFFAAAGAVEVVKGAGGFLDNVADIDGGFVLLAAG